MSTTGPGRRHRRRIPPPEGTPNTPARVAGRGPSVARAQCFRRIHAGARVSGHGRAFIGLAPLQPGGGHRFEFDTCRTTIRAGARRIPVLISIHAVNNLPRWVSASLAARLKVMPAVILTGARQTGKRTLAEHLVDTHRRFASLDDLDILNLARRAPQALLGGERPMTLAEVQREPDVLRAVKRSIDRNRTPGRILRTGTQAT